MQAYKDIEVELHYRVDISFNVFRNRRLQEWFKENKNSFDNNVKMIVAIPTDEIIKGLQYSVTEPLDKDKNILQWFYDAETGKVLKIRLIHFLSIDTNLQSLLLENEGMIVIKE